MSNTKVAFVLTSISKKRTSLSITKPQNKLVNDNSKMRHNPCHCVFNLKSLNKKTEIIKEEPSEKTNIEPISLEIEELKTPVVERKGNRKKEIKKKENKKKENKKVKKNKK